MCGVERTCLPNCAEQSEAAMPSGNSSNPAAGANKNRHLGGFLLEW